MPLDEELGQSIESKVEQLGMRYLYKMGNKARPPKNRLGLFDKATENMTRMNADDEQAIADIIALEQARAEGTLGPEAHVEGHVAPNGVPFLTLAATTPEEAEEISQELARSNIEHYRSVAEMQETDEKSVRMAGYGSGTIREYLWEESGPSPASGLYEIYLPDREAERMQAYMNNDSSYIYHAVINPGEEPYTLLSDLPYEFGGAEQTSTFPVDRNGIRSFIDYHDIENVKWRLSFNAAMAQSRGDVAWNEDFAPSIAELEAMEIDGVTLDDPATKRFTLEFDTVVWDGSAEIITTNLKELGIPYELDIEKLPSSRGEAGRVNVTVPEFHTGYVKEMIDGMAESGKIRGFDKSRFPNYDELAAVAENGLNHELVYDDMVFRSKPLPRSEMHRMTCALQELGIEHEIEQFSHDDTFTVLVKESEYRQKAGRINGAGAVLERIRPPEFKDQAQKAYERSEKAVQNRAVMQRRLKRSTNERMQAQNQRRARTKISNDIKLAKKSAEAQKGLVNEINRKKTLGK